MHVRISNVVFICHPTHCCGHVINGSVAMVTFLCYYHDPTCQCNSGLLGGMQIFVKTLAGKTITLEVRIDCNKGLWDCACIIMTGAFVYHIYVHVSSSVCIHLSPRWSPVILLCIWKQWSRIGRASRLTSSGSFSLARSSRMATLCLTTTFRRTPPCILCWEVWKWDNKARQVLFHWERRLRWFSFQWKCFQLMKNHPHLLLQWNRF